MKYCPFCGSGLQETMVFCPKCGKRFLDAFENPEALDVDGPCAEAAELIQSSVVLQIPNNVTEGTEEGKSDTSQAPKKKSKKAVWLVLALLVIVGGIVGFFGMNGSDDTVSITDAANSVLYLEIFDATDYMLATASGFVIDDGTTLVTNYHVIDGAHHIIAYTPDGGSSVNVDTLLAYNEELDLAILKTDGNIGVPPLLLGDSDEVKQGDKVFAVGYPLGVANTLSDGVVSSRYADDNIDVLQITAAISSGSSGGALFNESGYVIGVICASYIDGQNMNIAIPVKYIAGMMASSQENISLESFYKKNFPSGLFIIPSDIGKEVSITAKNLQGVWMRAYQFTPAESHKTLMTLVFDGDMLINRWDEADGSFTQWEGSWRFINENEFRMTKTFYTDYDAKKNTTKTDSWGETAFDPIEKLYENAILTVFGEYWYRQ